MQGKMKGIKFKWLNAFTFSAAGCDLIQCGLLLREPEKTDYYINTDSKF